MKRRQPLDHQRCRHFERNVAGDRHECVSVDRDIFGAPARPAAEGEHRHGDTRADRRRFHAFALRLDNARDLDTRHHRQTRRYRIPILPHQNFEEVEPGRPDPHQRFVTPGSWFRQIDDLKDFRASEGAIFNCFHGS
ncbi:hypothetical protein D3C87_1677120 [compost metagenome]